jgi:hypothetical protein
MFWRTQVQIWLIEYKRGTCFYFCHIIAVSDPSVSVQGKGDYNSNSGRNRFGIEAVKVMSKRFIRLFLFIGYRQNISLWTKIKIIGNILEFFIISILS